MKVPANLAQQILGSGRIISDVKVNLENLRSTEPSINPVSLLPAGKPLCELRLPFPPTVNLYWRRSRFGMYVSPAGKKFRKRAVGIIERLGLPKIDGPLIMTAVFFPPCRRIRDIDNYNKGLLDALSAAELIGNDSQIKESHTRWGPRVKFGLTILTLYPLEASTWPSGTINDEPARRETSIRTRKSKRSSPKE